MPHSVAVVGAGVIGLSCALKILQDNKDVKLTVYYENMSPDTTGIRQMTKIKFVVAK